MLDFKLQLPDKLYDLLPEHVRANREFAETIRRFIEPDPAKRFHDAGDAESGSQGLRVVHKQLAQLGKDTEYGRELQSYLRKLLVSQKAQEEHDLSQI